MEGDRKLITQLTLFFAATTYSQWKASLDKNLDFLFLKLAELNSSDAVMAFFTFGILAAAIVQAFITYANAKAAVTSAKVAQNTLVVMEENTQRQLRAYISASAKLTQSKVANIYDLTLRFKNSGFTPAYDFQIILNTRFLDADIQPFPEIKYTENYEEAASKTTITAGGRFTVRKKVTINNINMNKIVTHNSAVFIFGKATYKDAFNNMRYTSFRKRYRGPKVQKGAFLTCNKGNEVT